MIVNRFCIILIICLVEYLFIQTNYAQETKKREATLTTNTSDRLLNKESQSPFDFTTILQGGAFYNFDGGTRTGSDYMGRIHMIISLDTEKAGLWKNGKFLVNGVNAHGGSPTTTYIGDFQPISRNEAAPERTGLFELWYQHNFGKTSITIGLHDMNSALGLSEYGGNSINSAFGMNPSITPNVGNAFSIFPRTMPGIYLQSNSLKIGNNLLNIKAAVYAGFATNVEDDPYNIKWDLNGSTHSRLEIQYIQMKNELQRGVTKIGVMYHSGNFMDVTDASQTVRGNLGYYFITDQLILPEDTKTNQGLGLFLQIATALGNQNLIDFFYSFGINYKGLFPKRAQDILFLGFLQSSINNNLAAITFEKSRSIIELNYALKLGAHFTIQPDLQYIINPGALRQIENAFMGLLRFSINFY